MTPPPVRSGAARALRWFAPLLLLAGCSSTPDGPRDLTDREKLGLYIENAIYYLELGDLDRAQFQAEKALEIDPNNERFQLIYGQTNVRRGTAASIEAALGVLSKRPEIDDWRWHLTHGLALERKGVLYDEASSGVRDGSRPTNAPDRAVRADELANEARDFWGRARELYERAIPEATGDPAILNGLVRTTALLGDFEASLDWSKELIASIRDAQSLVDAELNAVELSADREYELREARAKNDEFEVKARLHAATILRRLDRKREAVAQFDSIIEIVPDLSQAYSLRAQLLMDLEEYVKARASLQRFLDLTDLPFDDPAVRRAFDLQDRCESALRAQR